METYGPNADLFSREDDAQELIDARAVTTGETRPAIVNAAFADFMVEGEAQDSTPDGNPIVPHDGAHITGIGTDVVFIAASLSGEAMLVTILHEAAHHVGHENHITAELAAQNCLREEEDDDEPGGGEETPQVTCTETSVWVEPVTVEVWVKPESTQLEGGPGYHSDLGEIPAVPIPGITVSVSSGYWATITIQEGYWLTVRECTST